MALSPAATALSKNATRIGANISKRLTRLASKDVQGGDILVTRLQAQLEEIRAMPVTNYNEARTKEARMRRLDKAAGTRAESFQKAARRAYRDDLVERTKDANKVIRMTNDELAEVYAIQRSRLRDRVRRVKQSIDGNNFMTHRAEDLLKEKSAGATVNRLRSLVTAARKALGSKALTPTGATMMVQRGVDLFGEIYKHLNDEQRSALWKAMRNVMEVESISSPDAIELIKTAIESGKMQFKFTYSGDELIAAIGKTMEEVDVKLKRIEIEKRNAQNIFDSGRQKWAGKDATNNDFWSRSRRIDDYTF